ncbi:Beta-lactamase-like domain protein [Candidatus Magnetomorum sp. HK-1]|nr:Beta-lactamase-like domain protein [Candidatus Magnetomorum sp. HK-1]
MNSTSINITILGSGTCVPSLRRSACSVLLEINDNKILIDSGPGTTRRLLEAGHTINQLSHIFYSHFHPDHISELTSILFSSKYSSLSRKIPLTVTAGQGLFKFYENLKSVFGHWIELENMLLDEMNISKSDHRKFECFDLETMPTKHNPESLGFRFTSKSGKTVVYSGDTDECDGLIKIAQKANLFICESAMPDKLKVKGHLTPSLAGKIAQEALVDKLILTHLYPECDKANIVQECRTTYSGPLWIAEDLMQLSV